MIQSPPIVDAHLDLAYNVARGRDPRMPAKEQPSAHNEIATVGLPDLRAGGVGLQEGNEVRRTDEAPDVRGQDALGAVGHRGGP